MVEKNKSYQGIEHYCSNLSVCENLSNNILQMLGMVSHIFYSFLEYHLHTMTSILTTRSIHPILREL